MITNNPKEEAEFVPPIDRVMANNVDDNFLKTNPTQQHIDGKLKRMQVFIKKFKKTRKSSSIENEFDKGSNEEFDVIDQTKEKHKNQEALLLQYEKDVKSAITYYTVILKKDFFQKLPGTATAVLESIIHAEDTINSCLDTLFRLKEFEHEKEEVLPLKDNMNRSITHLIRLSDNVLFDSYAHANIDKETALKAADAVSMSLECLYEFVLPRIRKHSVNEELLHCGTSLHSSANSLDTLDNIPETDILDDDAFISTGNTLSVPKQKSEPPPKPPLPNGNRTFYGNFSSQQQLKKANSQPNEIYAEATLSKDLQKERPLSDTNSSKYLKNSNFSNYSSKSSLLSTDSNCSSGSPNKYERSRVQSYNAEDYSMKRRLESCSNNKNNDNIDHEEIGMSNETYSNIQKLSSHYEILAKSSLSLFYDEDEDLLGRDDLSPPVLPKKKTKHTIDNYLKIVEGYDVIDYNERPSSYYDNLPVPNVHNITEDQFVQGDGLPKLPPKRGSYKHNSGNESPTTPKRSSCRSSAIRSKQRYSRRESSAAYDEDNIPALDCTDVSRLLVFKEKEEEENGHLLCGGTEDALIVYGADGEGSLFYQAFLATYRTFVSPTQLICKLLYRANRFRDKGFSPVSKRVLRLLVDVMAEMYEGLDKSLFDQLRSEVHRLLNLGELKLAKDLRDKVVNYCIKLQVNHMPLYTPKKNNCELFDFKSIDLAQQMCLLDADYFIKIELPEILRWGKEQSETLSPNLSRFIGHFNDMSFWVRTLILNEQRQQEREKMYKKFLKIMRLLRKLNNFTGFLAILSALDSTPVRRLEWPKHLTEFLAEDCKLIDSSSAFKTYRQALSGAKPPCIPYLGLILTDITFVHLGNPQDLPDGKVNFVKRWQQFNILESVRRFKEHLYDFPMEEKILDFFNEYEDHMDEDEMWEKSQLLRPRGK